MLYLEGMGPRQSIATEVLDTVMFGGLNKLSDVGYRKRRLDKGDAYVIKFAKSKDCYGAVLIRTPKRIQVAYRDKGLQLVQEFKYADQVKRFLVKRFIQD